jgi:hypothetical protein
MIPFWSSTLTTEPEKLDAPTTLGLLSTPEYTRAVTLWIEVIESLAEAKLDRKSNWE